MERTERGGGEGKMVRCLFFFARAKTLIWGQNEGNGGLGGSECSGL